MTRAVTHWNDCWISEFQWSSYALQEVWMTLWHHYSSINLSLIPGSRPLQMCTTLRSKILHKELPLCKQKMRFVACPVHQNAFKIGEECVLAILVVYCISQFCVCKWIHVSFPLRIVTNQPLILATTNSSQKHPIVGLIRGYPLVSLKKGLVTLILQRRELVGWRTVGYTLENQHGRWKCFLRNKKSIKYCHMEAENDPS